MKNSDYCKNCAKQCRLLEWLVINGVKQPLRITDCHNTCIEYAQYKEDLARINKCRYEQRRKDYFDSFRLAIIRRKYQEYRRLNPDRR